MKSLAMLLLFTCSLYAQVTNLTANVNTANDQQLSVSLAWSSVANATYNVYRFRQVKPCPAPSSAYTVIATGLTSPVYMDIPANQLGGECYTVTSVVNGVESAYSNAAYAFLGNHWYVFLSYRLPDCQTATNPPVGASLVLKQVYEGVESNIPVSVESGNSSIFFGTTRLFDDALYWGTITLADGTLIYLPSPMWGANPVPLSSVTGTQIYVSLKQADNTVCHYEIYSGIQ